MSNEGYHVYYSSSPVEVLHTVLLGCSKYILREFMDRKSADQKKEIMARIRAFPSCGLDCRVSSNISYFKSFVGRDFKSLMQQALFVLAPYFTIQEKKCWFVLSKVSWYVMCNTYIIVIVGILSCILYFFLL